MFFKKRYIAIGPRFCKVWEFHPVLFSSVTYVTVAIGGKLITLNEKSIEFDDIKQQSTDFSETESLNKLKSMFGFD